MTPVAGRVTNREEDRFIFFSGFLKSLFSPRIPIYGIIGVLQEIWTLFIDQTVRSSLFFTQLNTSSFSRLDLGLQDVDPERIRT
jgi:hypothetical protein